ncbi:hypothetical protein AKJ09_05994 [Labilithrix luteola]|uniref:Zinc-finger domain-containing protein n=1 Tax=Labilithrix luteola TaxID=1391654 RepID=A0A0K1Q0M7_9BACT|nr:hypothetical protein [Labilithrix luteola]AKU99330.1 hypothetical protein AKJ09_05994 [Labilithrix luteola]
MSEHPSSIALEAFACGESVSTVREHVEGCAECRSFVDRMTQASATFAADAGSIEAMLQRASASAERPSAAPDNVVPLALKKADKRLALLPLLAVAAGVLLWLRIGSGPSPATLADNSTAKATDISIPGEPETSFKGGLLLAVVRERAGDQTRFVSKVGIRGGDRLRIEVALDRSATILAGVLGEDGTFLDLMPEGVRAAGTHFSEQAAHFDSEPTRGWILVGSADAIARSKAAHAPRGDVTVMRLEWEGP